MTVDKYYESAKEFCEAHADLYLKWFEMGFKKGVEKEREACCSIIFGLCSSDNEAQRIVDAIKARAT